MTYEAVTLEYRMRRNHFTLEIHGAGWVETEGEPRKPTLTIDAEGSEGDLCDRLHDPEGDLLSTEETDVTYRLQSELDGEDATGVVSVTNRVTGDYIVEVNADAEEVLTFVRAARRYGEQAGDDGEYRVCVETGEETLATYDKTTFLVYNSEGDLLRRHSLIPSGIEL